MKKIKLIFTILAISLLVTSCDNDGGDSKLDLEVGAVPDINKIDDTDSFINLLALNDGATIDLGFTIKVGQGEISSLDVIGFYVKGNGDVYRAVLANDLTTFPATFNLSQNDLFEAFAELNSASDFEIGDKLIVTADMLLKNGSVINILNTDASTNYGQDIANSQKYTVTQTFNVSCPSELEGTYSVLSSGSSTDTGPTADENPITNHPYTVTITAKGGGDYTMSDGFGGLYILWYDIYGIDGDSAGSFSDVCNVISGTFSEPFGTAVTVTGSVNPDGTLTIEWVNGYGDTGVGVYTKN